MKAIIAGCALTLALISAANAQALYKEYSYGMPVSSLKAVGGVYDCEQGVLCLDEQKFMGEPVGIGFVVANNELRSVLLDLTDSPNPYESILMPLIKSGDWALLMVHNPLAGTSIDIIEKGRQQDVAAVTSFETGASSAGAAGYTLLEVTDQTRAIIQSADSAGAMLLKLPAEARFVDFVLNDPEQTYYMNFYLGAKSINAPVGEIEDF